MNTKELAKKYGMTEKEFILFCQHKGLLDKKQLPTQKAIDLGFIEFNRINNN